MDMVSALNRDLRLLVYRYIVDDNYFRVKAEYKRLWLNEQPCHLFCICWRDDMACFMTGLLGIMNWRDYNGYSKGRYTGAFYRIRFCLSNDHCFKTNYGQLPKNYW